MIAVLELESIAADRPRTATLTVRHVAAEHEASEVAEELRSAIIAMIGTAKAFPSQFSLCYHEFSILTMHSEHNKQTDQSWGGNTGTSEWADERAGEAIAQSEAAENGVTVAPGEEATAADAPEPEPEDKGRSLDDFLAEQAQKRIALGGPLAARKANEGSKPDKKWAQAKAINRDEQDDSYIAPQGQKSARQRERKEKQVVEIDHRFVEQPRERGGYRGGRGEGRGGRGEGRGSGRGRGEGRGEGRGDSFRGGRGRGEFRGRGEGRGEYRGRGEGRGEYRGRGGRGGANVNVADTSAFPSLGS